MSRSYKRHSVAVIKVGALKPLANKASRAKLKNENNVPLGKTNNYKKHYDYKWKSDLIVDTDLLSKSSAIKYYESMALAPHNKSFIESFPTLKDFLKMWNKYYRSKK